MPEAPPNAYQPNTPLTVGSHNVKVIKYISSGGFAHVYTCYIDPPYHNQNIACLKRVQVPNKMQLNLLRQEVDAMKRLKGNKPIVSYIDSHALRLEVAHSPVQQYEVCVLMEYCPKKGLIDLMNTRLQHKLTEPEILVIMRDITTAVAMCHHLQPPLLHRDIKIENVLIDKDDHYKLCDFGSAVNYITSAQIQQEKNVVRDDIMQHTTPQYRAPEMIDLSRGHPIDDKLDVWALGCLLYKLCYYITPFERPNQSLLSDLENLITHADTALEIPPNQPGLTFTSRLKNIITVCLREDPRKRPNAVQVLSEVCAMLGQSVPDVIPHTLKHNQMSRLPNTPIQQPHQTPAKIQPIKNLPGQKYPFVNVPPLSSTVATKSIPKGTPVVPVSSKPPTITTSMHNNNEPIHRIPSNTKQDPLPPKDNSKFLNKRPQSMYIGAPETRRYSKSSASLKEIMQKQINDSTHDVDKMRKSEEINRDTMDFLYRQEGHQSRQNTGGSIKSLKLGFLRKISTGGVSNNGTGESNYNRRSSISSIKQILTGGSTRKTSEDYSSSNANSHPHSYQHNISVTQSTGDFPERKISIKKRMAMLMKSNTNKSATRTAQGYGKYTDANDASDIEAINSRYSGSSSSLSSSDLEQELKNGPKIPATLRKIEKTPPQESYKHSSTAPKLLSRNNPADIEISKRATNKHVPKKKAPPPVPQKPDFLKVPGSKSRRFSTSSELSLPDIDDLEKQFSKRFPSKVL